MDLRFRPRARTTKDVDLSVALATGAAPVDFSGAFRERLQEAVDVDLGDYLTYRIGDAEAGAHQRPAGRGRYPCEAVLVGKTYAKFHIDVGCGDALVGEPERIVGDDLLSFAGIPPAAVLAISKPQQFAEKVHAYTFPWSGRRQHADEGPGRPRPPHRARPARRGRDPVGPAGDVLGAGDASAPGVAGPAARGVGGRLPGDGDRGGAVDGRLPRSVRHPRVVLGHG